MWKKIKDSSYYIHVTIDTKYEVFVTDFVKIWSCCFPKENYVEYLMKCEYNYGLEIESEELLDKGTKILLSPEQLCYASFYERDQQPYGIFLIICLTMDFGFELSIELNLELGSPELYFLKVSQPLLKIVRDLKESENELRKLVAIKDEEITEYKTQGGKIKYTALRPYNDTEHMSKHQCYNKFFESISDPQNVLNKTIDKCPRRPGREEEEPAENVSIKVEPSSAAGSSQANNITTKEPTDNTTIKQEPSSVGSSQANNVTTKEEPTHNTTIKQEPSSVGSSQANNVTTKEEPTHNTTIKQEPSSVGSSQANNVTTKEEPTHNTTIKQEPSSVGSSQANNVTTKEEPTHNTTIKQETSSVGSSQANNVTTKEEPTHNTTIKQETSSEIAPMQANSVTNEEHIDMVSVKVELPSADIDSRQENNVTTEVEVKKEYKPFMPKKKRLNI